MTRGGEDQLANSERFGEAWHDLTLKVRIMTSRRRSIVTNCYYKLTV